MEQFHGKTVYQIYVKSFQDSNGDGIGDLRGITSRLDYLKELGIDYIWTTPFFRSPQRDNGYDVADYYDVEPMFGTMADAEELIREAEKRGIGLMFDMVFNHTSTCHEWFQKALKGDERYQNYYIFRDGPSDKPPTNWQSKFGGSAWEYVPSLKKWYLHLFDVTQADLNWENAEVREELKKVLRFWKEKGVKGFRFDVVNLISKPERFEDDFEGDGRRFYTDGPHVHEFLKELVRDSGISGMVTVGEMSSTSIENCIRYSNPKEQELSMAFSFHHLKIDYKNGEKWKLMEPDLGALKRIFHDWQLGMQEGGGWNAVFWENHDQPRIVSRLGSDRKYWKESAKMLGLLYSFFRGTPYIYQGQELGMTNAYFTDITQYRDVESINYLDILLKEGKSREEALHIIAERSRDNSRTPMQWTRGKNAGFLPEHSTAEPWLSVPAVKPEANAEEEERDEDSILHFYRKLIRLRKEMAVIADGGIRFHLEEEDGILCYERYEQCSEMEGEQKESASREGETAPVFVLCNLTGEEKTVALPEAMKGRKRLLTSLSHGEGESLPVSDTITLQPYEGIAVQ